MTLLLGRQEGHLACKKTDLWGAGVVICLERGADLHMAQLMPLQITVSWFYLPDASRRGTEGVSPRVQESQYRGLVQLRVHFINFIIKCSAQTVHDLVMLSSWCFTFTVCYYVTFTMEVTA